MRKTRRPRVEQILDNSSDEDPDGMEPNMTVDMILIKKMSTVQKLNLRITILKLMTDLNQKMLKLLNRKI